MTGMSSGSLFARLVAACAAFLVVTFFEVTVGQAAKLEGRVSCDRMCGIRDLRLTGQIVAEDVPALQSLIGALHQAAQQQKKDVELSMMQVNSPGGSVSAAMAIGRLLRKESIGISVDPDDVCASACVLIFAGAVTRTFAMNLGIHRPYLEVPAQQVTAAEVKRYYAVMLDDIRSYLHEMNVVEGLADAMLRIPPEDVHFLTFDEANAYGLTITDPVFEETLDLMKAKQLGLDRREYVKRKALADSTCQRPSTGTDLQKFKQWTACIEETLKSGHPPSQSTPDFSRYGVPAPGR